jgi:hypothetical protein
VSVAFKSTLLLALVSLVSPSVALAQTGSVARSALRGIVRDASGLSVARATVSLAASDTALARVVEAPDGRFVFDGLVPGRYQVTAFAAGFAAREVSVSVPSDAPVTIVLEPAPVVENVRVTSASRQASSRDAARKAPAPPVSRFRASIRSRCSCCSMVSRSSGRAV